MTEYLQHRHIQILLAHIDGPRPISRAAGLPETRGTKVMLDRRLLATIPHHARLPSHTVLSESGRHLVAKLLANAAEALISAGCLEPFSRPSLSEDAVYRKVTGKCGRRAAPKAPAGETSPESL